MSNLDKMEIAVIEAALKHYLQYKMLEFGESTLHRDLTDDQEILEFKYYLHLRRMTKNILKKLSQQNGDQAT